MECSITNSQLQKIFLTLCSNCFIGIIPLFYIRVMYTYMYIHPSTLMLVLTPFFFCLLNPMCQVYLALLYIVYVYLTLLSVYIFRIKLLMLCLYTYAYCIYRCCIFYGFVYLPSETNTVSQGWKALPWFSVFYFSLYEVFMNLVLNCRTHIVNTQGYWCAMSVIVWLL